MRKINYISFHSQEIDVSSIGRPKEVIDIFEIEISTKEKGADGEEVKRLFSSPDIREENLADAFKDLLSKAIGAK